MSKTIEEIKAMREEAEKKIEAILTELVTTGVEIGSIQTYKLYINEVKHDAVPFPREGYKLQIYVKIMLHLQEKPE